MNRDFTIELKISSKKSQFMSLDFDRETKWEPITFVCCYVDVH